MGTRQRQSTLSRTPWEEEWETRKTFGRGAPRVLRQLHAQPTSSRLGQTLFRDILDDNATTPVNPTPPTPPPDPPSTAVTWEPGPMRWDPLRHSYVATSAGRYVPVHKRPRTDSPGRPPDAPSSRAVTSNPPTLATPPRPTATQAAHHDLVAPPTRPPDKVPRPPLTAAFNPGTTMLPLELGRPPRPLEPQELTAHTRTPKVISTQVGRIYSCTTLDALYDELLTMTPATPPGPRASENTEPASDELRATHHKVFAPKFRPGTMTEAGEHWTQDFGLCWEAEQVVQGVHWDSEWLDKDGKVAGPTAAPTTPLTRENYRVTQDPEHDAFISREVEAMLADGRLKDVTDEPKEKEHLYVLPIFAVRQGKKWRLIYDGREVNAHINCPPFRMETVAEAAKLLRPGDYMFSADMWAGFHQLGLREDMRKYAAFEWKGRILQWQVLPFGVNIAPRTYQKAILKLAARWRAKGFRLISYIDDLLFAASSMEEALHVRDIVLADLARYGLLLNADKAQLTPAQAVRFLGYTIDTSGPEVRLYVPEDKLDKIVKDVDTLIESVEKGRPQISGYDLASLLGKVLATSHAYAPARLVTRELFAALRQLPMRLMRVESGRWVPVRDYSRPVTLSLQSLQELRFLSKMRQWNGASWSSTTATRVMYTDGAASGYGGLVRMLENGKEGDVLAWSQGEHLLLEGDVHSTKTELSALLMCLAEMGEDVRGQCLLHRTDNVALHYALANGGYAVGENTRLNLMTRQIWAICAVLGIRLQTEFIGGNHIITSGADLLSRERFGEQEADRSRLKPDAFERICSKFGVRPTIDLFSERGASHGLPYYTRNVWEVKDDPLCQGYDALSQDWTEDVSFAYPPQPIIDVAVHKALREVEQHGTTVILITPDWPARPWTALLEPYATPETMLELGRHQLITTLPEGARGPIESQLNTASRLKLRAFLLTRK